MNPEQRLLEQLVNQYVTKKIEVYDGEGVRWVGICQSISVRPLVPSWGLVVVINRTPITNVDFTSIKLVE
jgi:hypothetical protein